MSEPPDDSLRPTLAYQSTSPDAARRGRGSWIAVTTVMLLVLVAPCCGLAAILPCFFLLLHADDELNRERIRDPGSPLAVTLRRCAIALLVGMAASLLISGCVVLSSFP